MKLILILADHNEYSCVYAWTTLGNICDRKCRFWHSDEAHLDLGGYVNKQNCRIWGLENPHANIEKPTYPKRVTVWCGFSSRGIIGPFFFENEQGETVTVNGDRYRTMLNEFLFTKIEEKDIDSIWYQQNGAKCHTVEALRDVLHPVFWISHYQPQSWCRLATTELRFAMRWTIICGVTSKPKTIDALKDNIHEAIGEI